MIIEARIKPNSSRNQITKINDTHFEIALNVPPIENKANSALIKLLAEYFNLAPSFITIKSGHKSKIKIININHP